MESVIEQQPVISCVNCTKRLTRKCPVYSNVRQVFKTPEYHQVRQNKYCDKFVLVRQI